MAGGASEAVLIGHDAPARQRLGAERADVIGGAVIYGQTERQIEVAVVKTAVPSDRDLVTTHEAVEWLSSLPGIGPFFSVLIRYEVDDISRFRTPKKFASYTGLVPSTYASGTRMVHGRLTKQGNKWLRWALIEAVWPAVRTSPWIREYYRRIQRRRGAKDARTATARKLAELAWIVWTERRSYVEKEPATSSCLPQTDEDPRCPHLCLGVRPLSVG